MRTLSADWLLMGMILLPAVLGALSLLPLKRCGALRPAMLVLGTAGNLALQCLGIGRELRIDYPWGGWGMEFSLRLYHFSGFILFCAALLALLVGVYAAAFSRGKPYVRLLFGGMLLTLSMLNGAVLANNLVCLLFFWEGILSTLLIMIASGGKGAYRAATKAFVIAGATDLVMMLGIGMYGHVAGTLQMDGAPISPTGWALVAFILLLVGALSKAGAMPFHTWIPDAADDAPMPFMAFLPGALEKLLGVYLLYRLCNDLFALVPGSAMSVALMTLGACTVLFAVMMALIQRDFKRLLSYHAVSQVGYMVLGLGTALPIGMVGALFHMLNNAVYKCCLFLCAGSVERQCGTTNLNELGGLGKRMPVTMVCFLVMAASIAGVPMTNGFFSKELIFDGALESGLVFYIVAAIGAFFTPVSFLKLGHAVFFGKPCARAKDTREAPAAMLIPMMALTVICVALGLFSGGVIERVLMPILGGGEATAHAFGHTNWALVAVSVALLLLAALDHYRGFKRTGRGASAADHFHYAPGLHQIYDWAQQGYFDPYRRLQGTVRGFCVWCLWVNDAISRCYDVWIPGIVDFASRLLGRAHNGSQARYALWVVGGLVIVSAIFLWY